jgi:hypothetical protein
MHGGSKDWQLNELFPFHMDNAFGGNFPTEVLYTNEKNAAFYTVVRLNKMQEGDV